MKKFSLLIILSMLILITAAGCSEPVFNGNRTSNDVQFIMDYSILSRAETHEMKLKEGATINVIIKNNSGRVDILVADTNGKEIYKGDNAASGNFSLKIPKTDTYKFSVTGSKAKGSVSFKVAS